MARRPEGSFLECGEVVGMSPVSRQHTVIVLDGFWIKTERLWQETPPALLWVLKQRGVLE